ncbi:MAG: leucine-rich repeat domain-containing protein [Bacteroidales bacterium]|nr:leucine-rich repeat domain-containing protein [Bacteroidales bacterium]
MKKTTLILIIMVSFAMQALAYDFQSGNLLYSIVSTESPQVSLDGHIDGTAATGELIIPETVDYEEVTYTVTQIGHMAFAGCSGLTGHLTIPATVETINAGAFQNCSGFTGDLVIPNSVTLLLGRAFWNCTGFDGHLTLSNSISKIYGCTFCGCSGLSGTLVIPTSVKEIAAQAFTSCGFTGTLVIPNSVIRICVDYDYTYEGYGSFQNCKGFTDLKLPNTISIIGDYCFAQCTGLSGELVIPEGVTELWNHAFWSCNNLTSVKFPNSLTGIGYAAFEYCESLTGTLDIPLTVTKIYGLAFSYCQNINAINLHSGIQLSGRYIFDHCSSLTEITIPEGWDGTGLGTFSNCSSLTKVSLPESMKAIESECFKECINLSEINLPQGVTSIGIKAFSHCVSLFSGELIIPDSVERIEAFALDSCIGITRIVLGQSINFVAEPAFKNTHLKSLVIKAMTPPELKYITNQSYLPLDLPIFVPCSTLEAYQNAEGWSEFINMHESLNEFLSVVSADETAGMVRVLKEATCDDKMVQVEAVPNVGCSFLYWEVNGYQVSTENPYSFELEEDTELVAHFSGTGLEELGQCVSVYPNPARDLVRIEGIDVGQIQIYNIIGQLVKVVQNANEVNVSDLNEGTYLVCISDGNGICKTEHVTIIK